MGSEMCIRDRLTILQKRAATITACSRIEEAQQASEEVNEQLRELCIQAEIRANADSPEQDQSKRMELQLQQLKQGFGQAQKNGGDNLQFIQQSRLNILCLGPITANKRSTYADRLDKSLQRLF